MTICDSRQEYEAALEVICGTRNAAIDDDVVMDKFTTHLDAHPEESQNLSVSQSAAPRVDDAEACSVAARIHALGIVQRARASDLLQAALASTAGKIRAQLSPEQAYERLGVSQTIEDDVILTAYEFAVRSLPVAFDVHAHMGDIVDRGPAGEERHAGRRVGRHWRDAQESAHRVLHRARHARCVRRHATAIAALKP